VVLGFSSGNPGYLFRYRLGGVDELRGYGDNRFRGKDEAVAQEELRWRINRWISFNSSVDAGDIGDDDFRQLKATWQLGMRVGLPPDAKQKLRLDYGVGADQMTLQAQFGEVF
jgi:outer membrane protein insertion porin family